MDESRYSHAKRTFYLMMALLLTTAGGMAAGNAHAAGLFFNGAGENETEAAADLFEDDLDEFTEEEEEIPDFPVEDVSIPPVVERPLGVDEGVKIIVNSFVLDDARDLPQHGIFLEEIYQALNENITATGEGVSIGRLQETAESITDYYRSRGLILTQVVLPVQRVAGGEVHFQVFEGTLGRILVEDNKMYSADVIAEPFKDLTGRPVVASEIESALLQLSDFPGLTVFGLFQPGQYVGEADLVLKVQDEERIKIPVVADNHGTRRTGRMRVRATAEINSPTRSADMLSVSWQEGYNPDNQQFWGVSYKRHLGNGYSIDFNINRNIFEVGGAAFASLDSSGDTRYSGGRLSKHFWRSRQGNFSMYASLAAKVSQTFQRGNSSNLDRLTVLGVGANYDSVDIEFPGLNFANFELSFGFDDLLGAMGSAAEAQQRPMGTRPSRAGSDGEYASGSFSKLFFSYTRLQTLAEHQSMLLRTELQWSGDLLVPLEQYSVGGPNSVRAYPVSEVLWDKAAFASVEYLVDGTIITSTEAFGKSTWGDMVQFSIFLDVATGKLNKPLPTEQRNTDEYAGFGTGLRLDLPGDSDLRIMVAWPLGNKKPGDGNAQHIWADISIAF